MLRLLARKPHPTEWLHQVTLIARNSSCPAKKKDKESKGNLAAVLHAAKDLRVEEKCMPEEQEGQVLIKMGAGGICHSDIHYFKHGRIGEFVVKKPMVLGHEGAGVVKKVGCGVKHLKVGDRVAVEPSVPCRKCYFCKHGRYNLCPEIAFCATPPVDGLLARYHAHPADFCYKLPKHVTLEEGALMAPLSVGVYACWRGRVSPGARVLVLGAGSLGLMAVAAARAYGASTVVCADKNEFRLGVAKKMCANFTLQTNDCDDEGKFSKQVKDLIGGRPHITIDCVGVEATIRRGLLATRHGGKFVLVGVGTDCASIPLIPVNHQVDIIGCLRHRNAYPISLSLMACEKVDVKPMITHCFKLEESVKAFETAASGKEDVIKIIIHTNKIE